MAQDDIPTKTSDLLRKCSSNGLLLAVCCIIAIVSFLGIILVSSVESSNESIDSSSLMLLIIYFAALTTGIITASTNGVRIQQSDDLAYFPSRLKANHLILVTLLIALAASLMSWFFSFLLSPIVILLRFSIPAIPISPIEIIPLTICIIILLISYRLYNAPSAKTRIAKKPKDKK